MNFIQIPKCRVGVIIGSKGRTKKSLEILFMCKLIVDSEEGKIEVSVNEKLNDPVLRIKCAEAVKAIGRGFSPEQAVKLKQDDVFLEVISLRVFLGKSKKALVRLRSRLIGSGGRTRKTIEEYTQTHVVISGMTVSIIGKYLDLKDAKDAIIQIIKGSQQNSVYSMLEEKRKERAQRENDENRNSAVSLVASPGEFDLLLNEENDELDLNEEFDNIEK